VFWVLFLGSIALDEQHPWVRTVWVAAWLLFLIIVALIAIVQIFRHRDDTGGSCRTGRLVGSQHFLVTVRNLEQTCKKSN